MNTRPFEFKYPAHSHNIQSLATANYPTSPRRNHLPPSSHQYSGNIQKLSIDNLKILKDFFSCRIGLAAYHPHPKMFKNFFACRIVLAENRQYPENIQRLSEQQRSTAATSNHPTSSIPAATSNHPATSSSNLQQQPAIIQQAVSQPQPAIIQQPAAAIYSSNQQSSSK